MPFKRSLGTSYRSLGPSRRELYRCSIPRSGPRLVSRKGKGIPSATLPTSGYYICFQLVNDGLPSRGSHRNRATYADDSDLLQISETTHGTAARKSSAECAEW
jgi:hypothetical protein